MWMYSDRDVKHIVEGFLTKHFNLCVYLNEESEDELEEVCRNYGREVENIVANY